jgi:hypothetical protein
MEREASTKETAARGFSGAETCGGVMVRGPASGNGERSGAYYPDPAELFPPRPQARALYSDQARYGDRDQYGETAFYGEMDPFLAGMQADGTVAAGTGWRGSGGRWLLWPLRLVLWVTLLVIVFRGLTAIVFNHGPAPAGSGPAGSTVTGNAASGQYPVALAEAYAAEFGRVYFGFSPQSLLQREQALAAFVPPSVSAADPNLGWNGVGQVNLQSLQVAGIKVQDPQHAVVTLLALISGQLTELGVPVAAAGGGGLVVSGEPAWLPAPQRILPPVTTGPKGSDQVARSQLMNELPAFFQAYASGDSAALSRFLAPGTSLTGLGGAATFGSISALGVPAGSGTRQITVTVIWQVSEQPDSAAGNLGMASKLKMTYGMSVVDLHTGKWYVKEIGASTEAVGAR